MMKKLIPFLVITALLFAVAFFVRSWAAVVLIILCLVLYYGRLYIRTVMAPQKKLNTLKKQMAEQQRQQQDH